MRSILIGGRSHRLIAVADNTHIDGQQHMIEGRLRADGFVADITEVFDELSGQAAAASRCFLAIAI